MPKLKKKTAPLAPPTIKGRFIGNAQGFGFVAQEDSTQEDIFIPPAMTGGALHGDDVICRLIIKEPAPVPKKKGRRSPKSQTPPAPMDANRRQTAQIIEVTHRKPLIGTYFTVGQEGFVRPVESKISHIFAVSPKTSNRFGLADGHRVVLLAPKPKPDKAGRRSSKNSIGWDERPHTLPCSIVEVIGHAHDPGVDVLTLVYQAGIPHRFSEAVETQVNRLPDTITDDETKGRQDLRNQHIITIDGEDTKDIDDAISLTQTPDDHYRLGVYIADVSHYVKPGTKIDIEALNRGTSVYLADRVIPMLPHRLSSGICSLFPGVDRLVISCMMTVDAEGHVVEYEIARAVINSKKRWTYQEVQDILDAEDVKSGADSETDRSLFATMDNLREILHKKRHRRGALDFNIPEAKIRVDEAGRPISIEPYQRTKSTGIIEEFMILANETIASHCQNNDIPLIYRAHDAPTPTKLAALAGVAKTMGFNLPVTASGPKAIQRLLEAAEASPAYHNLAMAALTSLPQAIYTPANPKHFGLASEAYCHFTSPIRRYADLQVHRILAASIGNGLQATFENAQTPDLSSVQQPVSKRSEYINGQRKKTEQHPIPQEDNLTAIAAQCSRTEREAEVLEREVAQLKKVQYMQGKEGNTYEGKISGITPWGVYVMLTNTIEGLLPSQHLKHHGLTHDKDKNQYVNKRKRESLAMGQDITVSLVEANADERKLTFAL